MKRGRLNIILSVTATVCFVVACAPRLAVTQDTPPESWIFANENDENNEYNGGNEDDSIKYETELPVNWWEAFGDSTLNRIVVQAILNNRDIEAAASVLQSAQANIRVVRANYLPSFGVEVIGEATHTKDLGTEQEYTIAPTMSWEVSLFGALRQTNLKARAEATESDWAFKGVRLSIAIEVANTYFTLLQAVSNRDIAIASYRLRAKETALIDSMFRYGMSNIVDLEQARSLTFTALADIGVYNRAVEQSRMTLSALLGENPGETTMTLGENYNIMKMDFPPTLPPLGIPSQLVERRPDVQQSYYKMNAAAAAVGIARAQRYPLLSLSGSGGVYGTTIKALTSNEPWMWSALGELTQTVLNFGGLKNKEKMAHAAYMEALSNYEQSMLTAFADVEKALIAIDTYAVERSATTQLVQANSLVSQSVGALYKSGMSDYLNVIDAERSLYDSQMSLVSVITEQYLSYITLCKALGGGY